MSSKKPDPDWEVPIYCDYCESLILDCQTWITTGRDVHYFCDIECFRDFKNSAFVTK